MTDFSGQSIGRYHIIERLGEGGMAVVYRAFDTTLECDVAIKFIRSQKLTQENASKTLYRFKNEAQKTARLTHPNIVPVTDYGDFQGAPYLVMKYLPGGTLKNALVERLKSGQGPYPYQQAAALLVPIARALEVAHKNGIVHRDIKPSNILLTESGQPMLTDFGIAKILESDETMDNTGLGVGIGTPEYMAPEQWEGKEISGQADVYALGVVFYELITGRVPFKADTVAAVMVKALRDPLPHPSTYIKDIPESVERIIYKAMAREVKDRYTDMSVFAQALEKLSSANTRKAKWGKEPEQSKEKTPTNNPSLPVIKKISLKNVFSLIGALILIAVLFAGGYSLWIKASPMLANAGGEKTPTSAVTAIQKPVVSTSTLNPSDMQGTQNITNVPVQLTTDKKPIFSENFEEGFAQGFTFTVGNWSVVDDGTGNKVLEQNNNNEWSEVYFGPTKFSNGVVEFRFRVIRDNEQSPSIVLYLRETPGDNGTTYNISYSAPTGITSISYTPPGKGWQPVEGTSGNAKIFPITGNSTGSWVTMRVVAQGKQMQVFLDDNLILTASDSRISKGILAIGAFEKKIVQFDDFKIWELNPSQSQASETPAPANNSVWKEGDILFSDDFESGSLSKWKVNGFWKIVKDESGNSVLQREGSETVNVEAGSLNWKNYLLMLRAKVLKYGGGTYHQSFCLGFRSDCQGDCPEYSWNFHQNFQNLGGPGPGNSWEQFMVSDYSLPLNQWLNLRVEVTDNVLRGFVNGEQFFEATDQTSPLLSGNIRLVVDGEAKVWFDDINVVELKPAIP